ncbi:unnamed protein product [Camellia sinensis]
MINQALLHCFQAQMMTICEVYNGSRIGAKIARTKAAKLLLPLLTLSKHGNPRATLSLSLSLSMENQKQKQEFIFRSKLPDIYIPNHLPLHTYCFENISQFSSRPCIINGSTGDTYTYADVELIARKVSAGLNNLGIRQGDVIMLLLHNSPEFVFSFLGASYSGITIITANPFYTPAEIEKQAKASKAKLNITLLLIAAVSPAHALGGFSSTIAVIYGSATVCGIVAEQTTRQIPCWRNDQLIEISPARSFDYIAGGRDNFCGVKSGDSALLCWDSNFISKRIYNSSSVLLQHLTFGDTQKVYPQCLDHSLSA